MGAHQTPTSAAHGTGTAGGTGRGRDETLMESPWPKRQDRQSALFPQGCLSRPSGGLGLWPLV